MGSRLKIGLDVDDVVADLLTPWLARYNAEYGTKWVPDNLTQWELQNDLGCSGNEIFKHLTPDIYAKEVYPFSGAQVAVCEIVAMGHEVWFVSNCLTPDHAKAKLEWLSRFGFLGPHTIFRAVHLPERKAQVGVDWLVDDHIGNLEDFPGYKLLMSRPHNHRLLCDYKRVKSLADVVQILNHWQGFPERLEAVTKWEDKDRGVRQFNTGATRDTDTGKLDYEGFESPIVTKRFAEFMHKNRVQADGSMRASDNWQKGIPQAEYMKSLHRHWQETWYAWRVEGRVDQEALCAMRFNTNGLIYEELKPKAA